MTVRCRRFANQLHGRFDAATVLVDERYSSAVISHQRGDLIDDRAAAIILQQYFDDVWNLNPVRFCDEDAMTTTPRN